MAPRESSSPRAAGRVRTGGVAPAHGLRPEGSCRLERLLCRARPAAVMLTTGMRRYHVTIAGRFPKSSVDQGLATFRTQFTQRGAWDEGLSGLREELGNVWLSVSSEFEAASPRAALMEALKAYEDDAHASIGHFSAMETYVQPADEMRGTTMRRTY